MTTTWRSFVASWLTDNQHSQAWLSRAVGWKYESQLTRLLQGMHVPTMRTLLRLEKAMGLRPQTLVRLAVKEQSEQEAP